jgi:hyperosmotically inducible periplasmic protein
MRMTRISVLIAIFALVFTIGCSQQQANTASVKDNIEKQFETAKLDNINIDEDREHKVLTLKGDVDSADMKQRAEEIARNAASGYTIANEIGVRPEGAAGDQAEDVASEQDKAIKAQFDAWATKNRVEGVDVDVKNGVVTLEGNVRNASQKASYEKAAKGIKGVEQVVNKLEVSNAAGGDNQ